MNQISIFNFFPFDRKERIGVLVLYFAMNCFRFVLNINLQGWLLRSLLENRLIFDSDYFGICCRVVQTLLSLHITKWSNELQTSWDMSFMFVAVDRVVSFLFFIFLAPPPLNKQNQSNTIVTCKKHLSVASNIHNFTLPVRGRNYLLFWKGRISCLCHLSSTDEIC